MPDVDTETAAPNTGEEEPETEPQDPFEQYGGDGFPDLPEGLQRKLYDLLQKAQKRDSFARRREILRVWKNRFFELGFQHCWWDEDNKILQVGQQGLGAVDDEDDDGPLYKRDIQNYLGYEKSFRSVFCQNAAPVRFQPVDAKDAADIAAAQEATKHKRVVEKFNNPKELQDDVGQFLWTDGSCLAWSYFLRDGENFGYEEEDDDAGITEEDFTAEPLHGATSQGASQFGAGDQAARGSAGLSVHGLVGEQGGAGDGLSALSGTDGIEAAGGEQLGEPAEPVAKGRECIEIDGVLEWKRPLSIRNPKRWPYVIRSKEEDIACAKADNPEIEEKITPGHVAQGSEHLARLARIACSQGASWEGNSQSTFEHLVTVDNAWFRKSFFTELGDKEDKDRVELERIFPNGCRAKFIGETYCGSWPEPMGEHVKVLNALKMKGQNVPGLGNSLIDPCEAFDDMFNMSEECFKNTIPQKIVRNGTLDIDAIREQGNAYGNYIEANPGSKDDPTRPFADNFFQETPVTPPEQMSQMMVEVQGPLMQFLSGQLAPLMGQSDEHNETAKGISILRDQALGLMSLVWTPFCNWYGEVMVDAIRCGAQERNEETFTTMVNVPGKQDKEEPLEVDIEALRDGEIMAAPVVDANFPESWTAKSNRFFGLFSNAGQNPLLLKLMSHPDNQVLAKDMVGMEDMEFPDADAVEKQVQEIALLIKGSPVPPSEEEVAAAVQQELGKLQQAAATAATAGVQPPPIDVEQLTLKLTQQMTAQLTKSSVPIDPETDNSQVEAEECLRWINSPTGQKMKYSQNQADKLGFQNVRLHWKEHDTVNQQKAAQAAAAMAGAAGPSAQAGAPAVQAGAGAAGAA